MLANLTQPTTLVGQLVPPVTTALTAFTTLSDLADRSTEDILSDFLELRISTNTRRTYAKALDDFFTRLTGHSASSLMVREFLSLSQHQAVVLVLKYQSILIDSGLTPSTINVAKIAQRAKKVQVHFKPLLAMLFSQG